jgi:heat shock protein 4
MLNAAAVRTHAWNPGTVAFTAVTCACQHPLRFAGSFDIGPFAIPAGSDKAKLKVKVMLNLNGVVVVENAQVIEEEEVEEEAPQPAAAPATDQPMADADAAKPAGEDAAGGAADAAASANGDAPMAEDAAAAAPAPQKVTKKRVKKHAVPFASHTAALSDEQLQKLYEVEVELALQVGWRTYCVGGRRGG